MLNILADSLLLATRMRPISHRYGDERDWMPKTEAREAAQRRRWLGLMGIKL